MNTFEFPPVGPLAVIVGDPAIEAARIILPADKPSCINVLVEYTPGIPGRTLTVSILLGNKAGTVYLAPVLNSFVDLTVSAAIQLAIPGGPQEVKITLASAGGAGADDSVTLTFQGLPTGTTIL